LGARVCGNRPQPLLQKILLSTWNYKRPRPPPLRLWFIAQFLDIWSISPTTLVLLGDDTFTKFLPSYRTPSTMCQVYYTISECGHEEAFYIRCGKYSKSNRYFNQPANQEVIRQYRNVLLKGLIFVSAQPSVSI